MVANEKILALIISTNKYWMGISRLPFALDRAGFISYALCPLGSYLSYTKFLSGKICFPTFTYTRSKFFYFPLAFSLLKFRPDVVIAGDEEALTALLKLSNALSRIPGLREYSKKLRPTLRGAEFDNLLLSKSSFIKKCQDLNISVPTNIVISTLEDAKAAALQLGFPLVLKIDGGYGGAGIFICSSESELIENFSKSAKVSALKFLKMLIKNLFFIPTTSEYSGISLQQFIPGITGHIPFCALNGKFLAGNSMLKIKTHPGPTGPSSVSRGIESKELEGYAQKLVGEVGYSGFGALDFIVQDGTDKIFIIEFNPRATPASHFSDELVTYDLCQTYFKALHGMPIENRQFKGFTVAMYPNEIVRDPKSSYLTEAFHDIPTDDPLLLEVLSKSIQNE